LISVLFARSAYSENGGTAMVPPFSCPLKIVAWYIQLTQAEAAFQTVKSDIGLRPIYHQKTGRVQAHLLVCFLSLALRRSLEMWMKPESVR